MSVSRLVAKRKKKTSWASEKFGRTLGVRWNEPAETMGRPKRKKQKFTWRMRWVIWLVWGLSLAGQLQCELLRMLTFSSLLCGSSFLCGLRSHRALLNPPTWISPPQTAYPNWANKVERMFGVIFKMADRMLDLCWPHQSTEGNFCYVCEHLCWSPDRCSAAVACRKRDSSWPSRLSVPGYPPV